MHVHCEKQPQKQNSKQPLKSQTQKNHFSWPIQQLPSPRQECNHLSRKADQVANHFAKAANQKKQWITNHCAQAASATYKSHSAIIHLWCFDTQRLAKWFTSFLIPDFFFFRSHWLICLCLKSVISDLTDFAFPQVEPIYLPGPTDWDGEGDRLTPGTCSNQLQIHTEVQKTQLQANTNTNSKIDKYPATDTRRWSWKRSSTRTTTSRGAAGSRWLTNFASQRGRSKFGSRTGETFFVFVVVFTRNL